MSCLRSLSNADAKRCWTPTIEKAVETHFWLYLHMFFFLSLQKAIRYSSLRKQPTFSDATTDFILLQPIRSTTQIWVVTRHRYGISAHDSQEGFRGETSGGVAKCRLFSQATLKRIEKKNAVQYERNLSDLDQVVHTHWTWYRSDWPRGFGSLHSIASPHHWIFTSVSVDYSLAPIHLLPLRSE